MRIISWNVNGLLSKVRRNSFEPVLGRGPDVVCVQEIRTKSEPTVVAGYHHVWNHAQRDQFWGTLTLTKVEPRQVIRELGVPGLDREGRLVACDLGGLWVVNVYVPNSQGGLERAEVRRAWDEALIGLADDLALEKPVVICGDFNVARSDDDIYEGNPHRGGDAGFVSDERSGLAMLLDGGYVDAFRRLHPDATDDYTWWSQRRNRRAMNHGWRLDYFLVSADAALAIESCEHLHDIEGSDHCPIELEVSL